uniref:Uncharacterized protein n=1 Tax=Brassica oleracea TaxID=3712 RepID=A0A3P6BIJ5_BRAOL|nr:unnamed protein product [Brassica oleracea]VDD05852.1 unnamed protein product [Brassica oleracea]VDD05887.1 unnamed protein product [Brassica oleracea]
MDEINEQTENMKQKHCLLQLVRLLISTRMSLRQSLKN